MKLDLENYGPGRPPLPETMDRMKRMVREVQKQPGIHSAKLARILKIGSLECATLADRLIARGYLVLGHDGRARTYTVVDNEA